MGKVLLSCLLDVITWQGERHFLLLDKIGFYFSQSVFFPFPGMLILAHVTLPHLFLPMEDGKGWSQEGSQTPTAEGVICRAL